MSKASTYETKTGESKTADTKTADTKTTQSGYETKAPAREGKSYAYQRPQEAAPTPSKVVEQKQKVVSAFDDFMDALAEQVTSAAAPAPAAGTGAAAGGSGATGSGGGTAYTPPAAGGTGSTGAVSGTGPSGAAGVTGPSGGAAGAGYGASSTGAGTQPAPYMGGERPVLTEAAKAAAEREAMEVSVASQRSAYLMDRARETTKGRARESSPAPSVVAAASGGVHILNGSAKHTSDSNRAPLTKSERWDSSYGALGKGAAPTIERESIPVAKRPETVPAAGTVRSPKPIDAYWGSFGTALEKAAVRAKVQYQQLESIIGTDDRVRVTNNEVYPWRCICSLLITADSGAQYLGTGWLVSPRLVLTAGHCVYMADEGGWVRQIEVIPGRDADERPFNSAVATDFRSVSGWTQDNDSDCDYGGILLPADKRYGEQLGWFGYASRDDDYLQSITLNLAGYPGDGGKAPNNVDGTQWYHFRTIKDVLEKQLTYEIDTYGGQSGAPVWEMASNGSRYGLAIHTFGTPVNNGGTRITGEVFDNIVLWAGQAP